MCGIYALNQTTQSVTTIASPNVVLATGGASNVYLYTSNPDTASGDGIAMPGEQVAASPIWSSINFTPPVSTIRRQSPFSISEALRGKAPFYDSPTARPLCPDLKRAELASRDIVARAIDFEMKRLGCDHVLLDISHRPAEDVSAISQRFTSVVFPLALTSQQRPSRSFPQALHLWRHHDGFSRSNGRRRTVCSR